MFSAVEDDTEDLIVDVKAVMGSDPLMPCEKGYEKVDLDLRLNRPSPKKQEYLYLSVKRDHAFFINAR